MSSSASVPVEEEVEAEVPVEQPVVLTGAAVAWERDFDLFHGQRVGVIANRASVVVAPDESGSSTETKGSTIDLLAEHPLVDLQAIFTPEHGLRGELGAGVSADDEFPDGIDPVTGARVESLYGAARAPDDEALADLDVLVFDLQDVGTRYYTYTATMGLAMQAAAEAGIPFVVLDRPNPLGGWRVDGAVRADDAVSFVSQYPIPAEHGMTAGELARAIVGEGWLDGLDTLDLQVVTMQGWDRSQSWEATGLPWVPPSPGLPTAETALLYPATVYLEGTTLSFGRGTEAPFLQIGAPWLDPIELAARLEADGQLEGLTVDSVTFTPQPTATDPAPRYEGTELEGLRFGVTDAEGLQPTVLGVYLLHHFSAFAPMVLSNDPLVRHEPGLAEHFDLLAGGPDLRTQLMAGADPASIVEGWQTELAEFDDVRALYSLY